MRTLFASLAGMAIVLLQAGCVTVQTPMEEKLQQHMKEQMVEAHLKLKDNAYGSDEERQSYQAIEKSLSKAVLDKKVGEFGGRQFGNGFCRLTFYGQDANKLAGAIEPILREQKPAKGSFLLKRFGQAYKPDTKTERVDLAK